MATRCVGWPATRRGMVSPPKLHPPIVLEYEVQDITAPIAFRCIIRAGPKDIIQL